MSEFRAHHRTSRVAFGRHLIMNLFDYIFHNPYQYSAAILAKGAVTMSTILWSVVVLIKPNALGPFHAYDRMLELLPEDVWAIWLICVALWLLIRLVLCMRPRAIGAVGYMLLGGFWAHVWWGIVINPGPFWPASFASVSCVVVLALFAFIANPKRDA